VSREPIRMRVGAAWLQRFDALTARGAEPRALVEQMAAEMDQLCDITISLKMAEPLPPMLVAPSRCPRCGKPIP
jgi:hypothetical protein